MPNKNRCSYILDIGKPFCNNIGAPISFEGMDIGQRVRSARKHAGLTQGELAKGVGMTQPSLSELERGISRSSSYLFQIAKICGVDVEWLATGQGEMLRAATTAPSGEHQSETRPPSFDENVSPVSKRIHSVPELSWVQAGAWTEIDVTDDIDLSDAKYWPCPVECSARTFALRVEGDSMSPFFPQGSIIFVDPEVPAISGKKVVAKLVDERKATFKQYIEDGNMKLLKAMNPNWPEKYVEINGNCEIIGTVVFAGAEV